MGPANQDGPSSGHVIRSNEFAGLRLVDVLYPARTRVGQHSHHDAVFCVGLTGLCSEVFAGNVREYEPSAVQFLPPGQCHSLQFPVADTRAFSVEIAPVWIERAREFSLRLDESVYARGGVLSGLMLKIYDEFSRPDAASPVAIQGLVMEMLAGVTRHRPSRHGRQPQRWLARTIDLLRESLDERLTLTQIAAAAGVHPVYMAREFRRFHGCSIGEYVRRLRVERACGLLSSSGAALATIAADAGFSDQSHFSRTFKRIMGMTPAEYRSKFDN